MAETFSGNIKFSLSGTFASDNDLSTVQQAINYAKAFNLTSGTGADQANMIFMDQRTIGGSADDLDLYGGLTNSFGTTINFSVVKGIIVYAASGNSGNVTLGGDGSAVVNWVGDASDTVVVKPGGLFALVDPSAGGYAVTNSSADVLQVAGTENDIYDIILLGEV
jgi:hypothetical protein